MKTKQVELEVCKNLGNYETAKIRLVATITNKENAEECVEKLNTMILKTFKKLYDKKSAPAQAQAQTQTQAQAQAQTQTQAQTPAQTQAPAQTPTPAPAQAQTQARAREQTQAQEHQEIKRNVSGKIIVEYSKDENSLFQRIKRAVRVRNVNPDEIFKYYTMDKETFKQLFV